MLEKIDGWVLWLTGQFVKKFNWLTGKDNFFLARVYCIGASFFFWVAVLKEKGYSSVALALLAFPLMFWAVETEEKKTEEERISGAKKDYYGYIYHRNLRLFTLLGGIFLFVFPRLSFGYSYTFGIYFIVAADYLLAVDKPLYSRSRAWELLKGWFKAILSPLPALKPVPVPVAPGNN